VDLPLLSAWVNEERVTPETWIYAHAENKWRKAGQLAELETIFPDTSPGGTTILPRFDTAESLQISPGEIRRLKLFANFSDEQILQLTRFLEVKHFDGFSHIVRQGDPGDAMFFILHGEVRVRMLIGGKETILATLGKGDFFGEISLFDQGPRSADVVANEDVTALRISAAAFQKLAEAAPELATPFLFSMGRALALRIRNDNKRFRDSVAMSRGIPGVSF
jgi:CRP-like cAMP-binding protein